MKMKKKVLLAIIIASISSITSCSTDQQIESSEIIQEQDDFVLLSSVEPPKYGERFMTVIANESFTSSWGYGDNYVWSQSGYPGFGYPIVIEVENNFNEDSLKLVVSWGEYNYELINNYECVISEDGSLLNYNTGESVVDFNRMSDMLFVICRETKCCATYKLISGTEVRVD